MKTKSPVRRNHGPSAEEMTFRRAIHLLQDACNDEIVLMQDTDIGVYLIPAIQGEDGSDAPGIIQYQVSNGLPGDRSNSYDYHHLRDAIAAFNNIVENGW